MPIAPIPAGVAAPVRAAASARPAAPCGPSFGACLEAHAARVASTGPGAPSGPLPAALATGLDAISRAQARLDGLLAAARSGRTFTPQELLVLQGEAYRYSQTVELSAKLVEQGAQALKQALHAQV